MYAGIHKEMAFQVLADYPNPNLLKFLVEGTAKLLLLPRPYFRLYQDGATAMNFTGTILVDFRASS